MLKKLSLSIVIGLCLVLFPLLSNADVVDSGICGDNAIWTLDDAGKLIISGTGDITSCPWSSDSVKNVVIEKGIVRI